MNKIIALILTVFLSIAMIDVCHSQNNVDGRELMTVDGTVAGVDVSSSTITVKTINEITFSISTNTSVMNDIYDIKLSDITPGDDVTVEYYEGPSGNPIATKITVQNKET